MKHNLFLSMLAAALLGSGVANAAGSSKASGFKGGPVILGSTQSYTELVVDEPLTLEGTDGYIRLCDGATIKFQGDQTGGTIYNIFTSEERTAATVSFWGNGDVYNFTFDAGAEAIVAASAGAPIKLIEDLNTNNFGFNFNYGVSATTLQLNGMGYGATVVLDGVEFTYVGPKENEAAIMQGQIGFTGYYQGSHALKLVANAPAVPEPTTGSLSLLALAGLCARRRK